MRVLANCQKIFSFVRSLDSIGKVDRESLALDTLILWNALVCWVLCPPWVPLFIMSILSSVLSVLPDKPQTYSVLMKKIFFFSMSSSSLTIQMWVDTSQRACKTAYALYRDRRKFLPFSWSHHITWSPQAPLKGLLHKRWLNNKAIWDYLCWKLVTVASLMKVDKLVFVAMK